MGRRCRLTRFLMGVKRRFEPILLFPPFFSLGQTTLLPGRCGYRCHGMDLYLQKWRFLRVRVSGAGPVSAANSSCHPEPVSYTQLHIVCVSRNTPASHYFVTHSTTHPIPHPLHIVCVRENTSAIHFSLTHSTAFPIGTPCCFRVDT